jgi:hypothetical protein
VWAIVAVCIVSLITLDDAGIALRYAPAFLLAAFLCWMLFWMPAVVVEQSGVTFVNIARSVRISWPAIVSVDTKYSLTVRTRDAKYTAWAAPAPSRLTTARAARADLSHLPESTYSGGTVGLGDIPSSDSGLAALNIRRYWEQLQREGKLDEQSVDGSSVQISWHVWQLIVLAVLAVATLAGILI